MDQYPTKINRWETTCKRYVAFLDIMGFKELMKISTHKEIYQLLWNITGLGKYFEKALYDVGHNIKVFTFSDSIIVLSRRDDTQLSFLDFSNAVSKIIGICIFKGVPIKGGCAHGEVTFNQSKNIICGQAYIDAYTMQENLFYYGVVCHHSIEQALSLNKSYKGSDIFRVETKMKGSDALHTNFDWFYSACEANYELQNGYSHCDKTIRDKINNFYLQCSGKPRQYVDNTMIMYERYLESDHPRIRLNKTI
jgi:hypothetical protein